jgi:hypothetical protein
MIANCSDEVDLVGGFSVEMSLYTSLLIMLTSCVTLNGKLSSGCCCWLDIAVIERAPAHGSEASTSS